MNGIHSLLVSTSYPANAKNWQGRFIADMLNALAEKPDLHQQLWAPPGDIPANVIDAANSEEALWLKRLASQGGIAHLVRRRGPFALVAICGLLLRLSRLYRRSEADLIHVNWLQNALPLKATDKPALITVLGSDFGLLKLPGMVYILRRAMHGRKVILAPNALWMVSQLEREFGDLAEIRAIPFGVEKNWFEIKRNPALISPYHWLAVTRLTKPKIGQLFEWGEQVFGKNHVLHLFGPRQDVNITIPDWVNYHGPTHPEALRNEWFPRASGLITLSQHDEGRPQVMLEAMAAGLPVIASNLAAHDDVILHNQTGMLVNSQVEFSSALESLSDQKTNHIMGQSAQSWIRDNIGTWQDCAERYLNAYRELIKTS